MANPKRLPRNPLTASRKPRGKPFQAGVADPRRAPGRPKGSPNKVTTEIKQFLIDLVNSPEYQSEVRLRILEGRSAVELQALYYAAGMPPQKIEAEIGGTGWLLARITGQDEQA